MVFAAPWLLVALAALPVLWWLLRVTPPAPRTEHFPAIRLLAGLRAREETPSRTPLWLLALRLLAAALLIIGLARPVLDAGTTLPGSGPVLLVMDDGWAAAADWPARLQAANAVLDRADRAGRPAALLTLARNETNAPPAPTAIMPVAELRPRLAALRPKPWPDDRTDAAAALANWNHPGTAVALIPDGLQAPGDTGLAAAFTRIGEVDELTADATAPFLLLPPRAEADRIVARLATLPLPGARQIGVLAQTGDGRTLARTGIDLPAGASNAEAAIELPPELRNQLSRLVLDGPAAVGGVVLLDETWRRRPVGLLAGEAVSADTPLAGDLYFLRQALGPSAEIRTGDIASLLARDISVIMLADRPVTDPAERAALTAWVRKGGLLVRFAGPRMAELTSEATGEDQGDAHSPAAQPDTLLPEPLLAGDRQLGGALSWSQPAGLARFPANSPFAGLTVPAEVTVSRQVLAEPGADLPSHTWAALADGTPLVTTSQLGDGRIVLFHTTANADWSNLALSGLFVDMLHRLVELSVGVASPQADMPLSPAETLDGFGQPGTPPPAAQGLAANQFANTPVSPLHPPGLYGPETGRQALNLSATLPGLREAAPLPGARRETLGAALRERALGPWLLAAALALFAIDLLVALWLRGLLTLRPRHAGLALLLLAFWLSGSIGTAHAQGTQLPPDFPALVTRLAYVVTGDDTTDAATSAGLAGLADYVNRRTAANLGPPAAVMPGQDDLSFYPFLYWAIASGATPPGAAEIAAMNDYMGHGGIIVIDTRGNPDALPPMAHGLLVPTLTKLTSNHVLARSFYLLDSFPGRDVGAPVWVQRDQDRTNDSVSPVVIGDNDWAGAWAMDPDRRGAAELPGGDRQRTLAFRFGVNLVMYALTGNYKGDQVHVPAILERLGQ